MNNQNNNDNNKKFINKIIAFFNNDKNNKSELIIETIFCFIQGIGCLGELIIGFFAIVVFVITLCILKFCFHMF